MKSWIETFSVSMKLPIHSNEEYIWDHLIHSYPTNDDEILKSFGVIPLREYADVGLSLLKWFIDNKTYLLEQDLNNFNGLLESILDIWCESVNNMFENLTFEDKNHIFKGLFRMSRNMQVFVETYPFFQAQIDKLDQLRSSLEIIKYDTLNLKKIKTDLNKITHWSEAVAVSVKLPTKTKIMQIIDYLVERSSEELENFLEGIATIDIELYPKIGEMLLNYYIFKSREDTTKTFNGYERLVETFLDFWFEKLENIFSELSIMEQESILAEMKQCDDKIEDLLEELPIFEQCHKKINELFERLEPLEAEEENEQTRFIET